MPLLDNSNIQQMKNAQNARQDEASVRRQIAYKYGKELYDQTLALFVQAMDEFIALAPKYGLGEKAAGTPQSHLDISCSKEQYKGFTKLLGFTTKDRKAWYWFSNLSNAQKDTLKSGYAPLPPIFEGTSLDRHIRKTRKGNNVATAKRGSSSSYLLLFLAYDTEKSSHRTTSLYITDKGIVYTTDAARVWPSSEAYFSDNYKSYLDPKIFSDAPKTGTRLRVESLPRDMKGAAPPSLAEFEQSLINMSQKSLADSKAAIKRACEAALAGAPLPNFNGFGLQIRTYSEYINV